VLLLLAIGIVPPQHAQAQSQNKVLRFLEEQESTLVNYYDGDYPAWYIVSSYGDYYQVDPFLLLALMEAATGVVTDPEPSEEALRQPFGAVGPRGFTRQVQWAIRELMLGRGTYTEPPTLRFSDGKQVTLDLRQSDLWLSIRRFTAQDRTYDEWYALDERMRTLYPIYRQEQPVAGDDSSFAFLQPPTISRATYRAILREWNSPAYPEAGAMYDVLVDAGIDPVIELAFARKETEFGRTGPGRAPQHSLHGITCNAWDQRYGGTCMGPHHYRFSAYPSYTASVQAWATLIRGYARAGMTTPRLALPVYAPAFENDTALYTEQVYRWSYQWRSRDN
jgi:hypothetical protein